MTFKNAVPVAVVLVAWGLLIEAPSIIHGGVGDLIGALALVTLLIAVPVWIVGKLPQRRARRETP